MNEPINQIGRPASSAERISQERIGCDALQHLLGFESEHHGSHYSIAQGHLSASFGIRSLVLKYVVISSLTATHVPKHWCNHHMASTSAHTQASGIHTIYLIYLTHTHTRWYPSHLQMNDQGRKLSCKQA